MRRICVLVLLVTGALVLPAPAAQAVIGGSPDGGGHPYVGWLVNRDGYFCSGSLISPSRFLTAAHCSTEGARVGITNATDLNVGFALTGGTFHQLPGYCDGCDPGLPGFAVPDLAVVTLDRPITAARYARLPQVDQSIAQRKGTVDDVGYGVNGYDRGGGQPSQVLNFVRTVASLTLSGSNETISDTYLKLSSNNPTGAVCFGDSGGPVLTGDIVLGVNSIVNGMCTASTRAYRVDTAASLAFIAAQS